MSRPFFKVARGIHDHPRFAGVELCEVACATWLFDHARHVPADGLDVGQLRTTYADLVRAWRWQDRGKRPEDMVRRLLRKWSTGDDPMIDVEADVDGCRRVGIIVTVLRYADWQRVRRAPDHAPDPSPDRAPGVAPDDAPDENTGSIDELDSMSAGPLAGPSAGGGAGGSGTARAVPLLNRDDLRRRETQQRAHAREAAAAADPRLSWEAVRDLWVETWRGYYDGTPKMKLGGPHLGPVAFVAERLIELADEVGVDDAVAHVAAVFETYLEDKGHWFLTNQHPLAWLTKADEGATEPRWHQWAMRDPWYAARQSSSHHVAQSEASLTSATPKPPAQSHDHHVADLSLPTYSRATGEDADEVREVLQQLVNDGLDAIKTGVLCRAGDDLALVFSDDMDMLLSAKRLARYLPDVACMHGAVEREQRGAA